MDSFIGVAKLHPHQSKRTSPFLGRKLKTKLTFESQQPSSLRITISNSKTMLVFTSGGSELIHALHDMFLGVGLGLPCTVMECGDITYRSTSPQIQWLDAHSSRIFCFGEKVGMNGEGAFGDVKRVSLANKKSSSKKLATELWRGGDLNEREFANSYLFLYTAFLSCCSIRKRILSGFILWALF